MENLVAAPKARRVRTVLKNTEEVCHVWASCSQEYGKNSSESIWFYNKHLYSYRRQYLLGSIFEPEKEVFISTTEHGQKKSRFGNGTDIQRWCAQQAVTHFERIWLVPQAPKDEGDIRAHHANTKEYEESLQKYWGLASRCRRYLNLEYYVEEITRIKKKFDEYHTRFGEQVLSEASKDFLVVSLTLDQIQQKIQELMDSPRSVKMKVAHDLYLAYQKAREEERQEKLRIKYIERKDEVVAVIESWLSGLKISRYENNIYRFWDMAAQEVWGYTTFIRVSPYNPGYIETSHSAQVPVEDARRLVELIKRALDSKSMVRIPGLVGSYSGGVLSDGSLRIGCHEITFAELKRFSDKEGWGL